MILPCSTFCLSFQTIQLFFRLNNTFSCLRALSVLSPISRLKMGSSLQMGTVSWSMNQIMLSLLTDCLGLKHLRIRAAKSPKAAEKPMVTINEANCNPPCLEGLSAKVGDLEFLPAVKIESKMPPKVQSIMASSEYLLGKTSERYFSRTQTTIGANIPIRSDAKGSMMTTAEELKNMPDYIIHTSTRRRVLMNLSKTIFSPRILKPIVVPMADEKPKNIWMKALAISVVVFDMVLKMELPRQYQSTFVVVELKLNQSMMHSTRPITFMVIVKYLSLSSA